MDPYPPPHAGPTGELRLDLFRFKAAGDAVRAADWAAVHRAIGYALPDEAVPSQLRCILAYRGNQPVARLALGVRRGMAGAPGQTGFVGWYEATDRQAGTAALVKAAAILSVEGADRVVGPLNGSTWSRYRLAEPLEDETLPQDPFLSEPQNPTVYGADFAAAGYRPALHYESRWVARPQPDPEVERVVWPRLAQRGIALRDLDLKRFQEELAALFELSAAAFADNALYSPIPLEEFAALYEKVRPLLDARLVRIAADAEGRMLGYVFAFSDPLAPPEAPRIVLKTLAASPEARGLGLGRALVDDIHRTAHARGQGVIHALMHVSNASKNISARSDSALLRRYVLYQAPRS